MSLENDNEKGVPFTQQTRWRVSRNEDGDYCLLGKYGVITMFKDGTLDVWVKSPIVAGRIERGGWRARNHYDDGAAFVRPFSDLDQAAREIRARKKRQVTEAMREMGRQGAIRLRSWREKHGQGAATAMKSQKDVQRPEKQESPAESTLEAGVGAKGPDSNQSNSGKGENP